MNPDSFSYRPDIDGLRAVAVTTVVFFHAGIPGFTGGYAGVDVFFVISGYLIISIIARDLAAGSFSLAAFYERRARRILPALLTVFAAVFAIFAFAFRPWELADTCRTMNFALLSCSNIAFARQGGYFGGDRQFEPLLHTWSLGIEEQFYLITPLLMMLAARGPHALSRMRKMLICITAGSLVLAVWRIHRDPGGVFYLMPYRAWELSAGGLLALCPPPAWGVRMRNAAAAAGLAMIAGTTVFYTSQTPFPGATALLPCVGALLVIAAGSGGRGGATRLLSLRFLTGIGLISYSVYLWHWPVFVLARTLESRSHSLAGWVLPVLAVASFAAGWISWKYVETPFRDRRHWGRRRIFTFSLAGTLTLLALAVVVYQTDAFLHWRSPEAERVLRYRESINPVREEALSVKPDLKHPWLYGEKGQPPSMVLWGDSHADVLAWPLHKLGQQRGFSFLFYGARAAPPVANAPLAQNSYAEEYTAGVLETISGDAAIRTVILAARWGAYTGETVDQSLVLATPGGARPAEPGRLLAQLLERTIARLESAGKTVVLVYPVPEPGIFVPRSLAAEVFAGRDPHSLLVFPAVKRMEGLRPVTEILDGVKAGKCIRFNPAPLILREDGSLRLMSGPDVLYHDLNHLTLEGGALVVEALVAKLEGGDGPRHVFNPVR
jgi:peptidoglycan/LPS O-acetylase OafA/YrhL